jgi:hypothetical protein
MEEKHEPTLVWLQERLLLDEARLSKLVKKDASFLGLSQGMQSGLIVVTDGEQT